ncbi:hypothetical protein EDC01DRAFT_742741 [Geopyxis carbonaria]|nr:hypothetical protein EDC01DRAFT_742741 [Geopyxis carbonaria]
MPIASGSTPTSGGGGGSGLFAAPDPDLEAGYPRPHLARSPSSRHSFPFPLAPLAPPSPGGTGLSPVPSSPPPPSPGHTATSAKQTLDGTSTWSSVDPPAATAIALAPSLHAYRHLCIFRRFGALSLQSLLQQQCELAALEHQHPVDPQTLRSALSTYHESLLLLEQVLALEQPRAADRSVISALAGIDLPPDDVVALGLSNRDSLEKVVGRLVPRIFPGRCASVEDVRSRRRAAGDIASVFSPFTRRVTRVAIAAATAALMLGPMAVLRGVPERGPWRLVVISGFTVALAMMVALGTRGRGEAIVMVIAAYAAVLVVFVQNTDGPGGGGGGGTAGGGGTGI